VRGTPRKSCPSIDLNEFNHFEVDMSIFQPAIYITDTDLLKEKDEIIKFIADL
jgi:hypothetical protein